MPPAIIQRLLAMYGECSADGEYEAAYHLLMAALHLADHAADLDGLNLISAAADNLEQDIEAISPPHPLCADQAARRGQQPLTQSLRVHIEAVRLRLRSDDQRGRRLTSPA